MKKFLILFASALFLITACDKEETETEETPANTTIPAGPYKASYTIDGRTISFADGSGGYITPAGTTNKQLITHAGPSGPDTTLLINAMYSVSMQAKGARERLIITMDTLPFIDSVRYTLTRPSVESFNNFFSRQQVDWAKGLQITFYDVNGKAWSTNGAQTEKMNFANTGGGTLVNGAEYVTTTISFNNLVLYNTVDPTLTKLLTGGNISTFVLNSK